MLSRMNSSRPRLGGVRGRDNEFPVRVTDNALMATTQKSQRSQKSELDQRGRETLPERPRTSAGPTSSQPIRRSASKRETKDDLQLSFDPLKAHGTGTTFYDFPLPGSLPTPTHSPKELTLPPRKSSLATSPRPSPSQPLTPDSMDANSNSATMAVPPTEIGMALGSPSQQPSDWPPISQHDTSRTRSPDIMSESVASNVAPAKAKGSRWKVFGGLFGGKKQPEAQQPFYQVQPLGSPQPAVTVEVKITTRGADANGLGEPPAEEEEPKTRGRGRSFSTRRNKNAMKRANTAPSMPKPFMPTPEITLDGGPLGNNKAGGQLLDVDIPSIQMERYSIMFGSVLQKTPNNSSTLLARRQATLDKLKTANAALAAKEREILESERRLQGRRATSPGFAKSPGFSLFPSTPSRTGHSESSPTRSRHRPSGSLQRSNTSPAALSPSRPSFAPGPDNSAHANLVSLPAGTQKARSSLDNDSPTMPAVEIKVQKGSVAAARSAAMSKQKAVERSWSPDESHLALSSPESADIEYTYSPDPINTTHDPAPLKPKLVEPTWEIINESKQTAKPPTTASSNSGSDHSYTVSSSSTSALSVSTMATSVSVPFVLKHPSPEAAGSTQPRSRIPTSIPKSQHKPSESIASTSTVDDNEGRLKAAADVSIARQISVSRQQRQLLVPINMKKTPSSQSLNKGLSASPVGIASHKSPLGAVATAASEERDREGRGMDKTASPILGHKERLVNGVKPTTPTLVIVPGPKDNECVKTWDGHTTASPIVHPGTLVQFGNSIAERRRGKEMGEIKVGLAIQRSGTSSNRIKDAVRETKDLQHRKSERVIVERVGVTSN